MTTSEFLQELENHQIVPQEIMQKLRDKLEKTDKDISAKSVAKYLIDKGYLSKYQAKQILTGASKAPAREELDLEVPAQQVEDTNELLKDLNPAATVANPAPDKTRAFTEQDAAKLPAPDVSIEVVDVEIEQTMQQGFDPATAATQQGGFDPLGGTYDSHFGTVEEEVEPLDSFTGKKGKKNQWDSKWIFIGSSILALLIMVGVILAFTIFKADSAKMWETAVDHFNNGRYTQALEGFQNFIQSFPGDPKVPDANVKVANCNLRIPYEKSRWDNTLAQAQTELAELYDYLQREEKVDKFDDLRGDLSVILPGTALGFTKRALESDDVDVKQDQLKLAQDMMELINNPTYLPTSKKNTPGVMGNLTKLGDEIGKIQRQIKMEHDYTAAVEAMNSLTEAGDTQAASLTYLELTGRYPELKIREEIQEAMLNISLREADLVETVDVDLAAPEMPGSPIASSVILATKSGQASIPGLATEMVVHLIDGTLYGIRAVDGKVVWQKYVGVETNIEPVWIDEEKENKSDVIAVDSRNHDLMRLSHTDGSEVWRIRIGEPFAEPNVTPLGVLVTTLSGKVMKIEPGDGSTSKAAHVPKDCMVSGVVIEDYPFIYQVARDSNLYVISTESMSCREVYYLGHDPGAVTVRPFVISGHLLVPVNAANYCNLHVIKPFENGLKMGEAQVSLRFNGQINTPILRYARWAMAMSDIGDLQMIEVTKADEERPADAVVTQKIAIKRQGRHYLRADSQQLWICGAAGIRRYRIQNAVGRFNEDGVANNLDAFVGPTSLVGETLYHIRRRNQSSMVSVSAVNPESLEEIWRTDFAAPLAGPPLSNGSRSVAISAQGDVFEINEEVLNAGNSNSPIVRGSTVVQTLVFDHVVDFGDRYVVTGPLDRRSILAVNLGESPPSKLSDLQPPADKPACEPIAFGDALLVATKRGQVFRIDPSTGRPIGAPFQPPLQPNTETLWRRPMLVGEDRFMIGDDSGRVFLVRSEGRNSLQKVHEIDLPGDLLSSFTRVGDTAFAVTRTDNGDRIVSIPLADQLEPENDTDLPGGYVAGPIAISDSRMIVLLDTGETVCFNADLVQQWVTKIPPDGNDKMAGEPTRINDQLIMAFVSGLVVAVDPATGEVTNTMEIGRPIAHPPVEINGKLFVTGADGTLHQLTRLML